MIRKTRLGDATMLESRWLHVIRDEMKIIIQRQFATVARNQKSQGSRGGHIIGG
jgi:hypothetical protein